MFAYDLLKFALSIYASNDSVIVIESFTKDELWNNIGDLYISIKAQVEL